MAIRFKFEFNEYSRCGGYPLYYTSYNSEILCHKCAEKEKDDVNKVSVNYNSVELTCEECGHTIKTAY